MLVSKTGRCRAVRLGGAGQRGWAAPTPLVCRVEQLSWKPRAYYYHNFISAAEADHLVSLARPYMQRSTVVGGKGGGVVHDIRTSYGTFLNRGLDAVVSGVERRLATWTHLNVSHQEDMQILRYGVGQKYGAHYDSLSDDSPRVVTVLIYLADTEEGGETAFPSGSRWLDPSLPARLGPFSPCAQGNVAARPRKGDALLFYSLRPDGTHDPASLHTGCPVVRGVKWTATKWIHTEQFRPGQLGEVLLKDPPPRPEDCVDMHAQCDAWAASGECTSNAGFMIGMGGNVGGCRKACDICEQCAEGDIPCRSRNRERSGFLPLDLTTGEII